MTAADYDLLATSYDEHFGRPVDAWEDTLLANLLRPYVNGERVLDLGCGTGWLLDHLRPAKYLGLDPSAGMLQRLHEKHPTVPGAGPYSWCEPATEPQVRRAIRSLSPTTVVATWAAHEFDMDAVMGAAVMLPVGGIVALHGQGPAYAHREHYVAAEHDDAQGWRHWTPASYRRDYPGLRHIGEAGTGASDNIPDHGAWRMHVAVTPTEQHYGILSVWRRTA